MVRQRSLVDYGGSVSPTPSYTSLAVASGLIDVRMAEHVVWGAHPTKDDGGHGPGSNGDSSSLSSLDVDRIWCYLLLTPGVPSRGMQAVLRPTSFRSLKRMSGKGTMISSVCRKPNGDMTAPGPTRSSIISIAKGVVKKIGSQDS